MLVVTRKQWESVQIGNVVVTVVRISGDEVRLGIDAQKDVRIMRTEILDREKARAEKTTQQDAEVGRRNDPVVAGR